MQSKAIINFAALVLCSTVSLNSVYAQTAGKTNSSNNKTPRRVATAGKTVLMPALPNAPNANASQKTETNGAVNNSPAAKSSVPATVSAKKESTIRIGIASVKTGAVGDGMSAADLANAVQQTLGAYFKGTKIELVPLEARLASAQANEIQEKQCDFVLDATVALKKGGGGGFGKMFGSIAPVLGAVVPGAGMVGMIAGSVASTAISGATANIKPKDEITLDLKINAVKDNSSAFAKQYKAKAKKGGDDIISPLIEQAAQEILDQVAK